MTGVLEREFDIEQGNFTEAGEASSKIKTILKQLGIDMAVMRKVSIASYEAELNTVIHSYGGKLYAKISPKKIVLIFEDTGPGIEDVELAMQEGYSTASDEVRNMGFGAGLGLSNIKKCSDDMKVESSPAGTKLTITFNV